MEKINFGYTHQGSVAQITLNAPGGNILDRRMMIELLEIFQGFQGNRNLKLITLEGAGEHFSYGASVEEHQKEKAATMLRTFHQLFFDLIELRIPALAKVSGFCLGGALELALMCDFIYADRSAKLGQPEILLGVFPPPASLLLPLKIGYAKANALLITGKTISAEEAKALGLVNEVYPDKEKLDEGVQELIEKHILPRSACSLRYAVRAARTVLNETILTKLPQLEKIYLRELMESHDANEGIQAFLEKRKPEWKNA